MQEFLARADDAGHEGEWPSAPVAARSVHQLRRAGAGYRNSAMLMEVHESSSEVARYQEAIGSSPAMGHIFSLLPRIASSNFTVLLEGETGTGKTLIAEAIHRAGPRASRPFVVVDTTTIPSSLIESALFGHEKGAFTGAHASHSGAFELAQHGTILLDEIGELPQSMQPKLLRVLEAQTISRVGSFEAIPVHVRVIAATNRNLAEMVNRGEFRSDLFYRLNMVRLRIPPLRERREDIPILIRHFYDQLARGANAPPLSDLIDAFYSLDWPGNVRELRNAVYRAVLLNDSKPPPELTNAALLTSRLNEFDPGLSFHLRKQQIIANWERSYLQQLIKWAGGSVSRAARAAQMDRGYLRDLLKKYNLNSGPCDGATISN